MITPTHLNTRILIMASPIDYTVTCTKPVEGEIYSETFHWYDYDTPSDLRLAVAIYCNESVELGWDVEAFDSNSKIIFTFKHEG